MDTRIATTCPTCGRVELELEDVALVWEPHRNERWFLFDCLHCASLVVKDASPTVAAVLILADVRMVTVPAEVSEHRDGVGHLGTAVQPDDVLDAVLELRGTDFLAVLAATQRAG